MLKIRLQRVGRKHEPTFRLVLTDSKNSTKSGKFKEILGSYDARKTGETINTERSKYWISMGAGLTDTVHNLFVRHNIIDSKKKNVLPKKTYTPPAKEEVVEEAPAPAPVEEVPAVESAPEPTPVEETPVVEEVKTDEPAPETESAPEETSVVEETPTEEAPAPTE